ncbi:ABC transporter ATP-binding protein [Paenibacillus eucommiae]|uniref:ABC-type bacteriocin/lantibiotic exporter with double-glycine peptidase domain n=1 Tax=Paenibacillus eucommiae TaxID=1355755 RepID=A0ABS4J8D5_9BACL|nr:ABC transporter ATP-binding protein [Paenibacillus eucommiae]MBP1996111.1 ABC-type bacteriocin/lantibiotic exporter with double-glycine peptidase domain [Paenibacillus eucommiae]
MLSWIFHYVRQCWQTYAIALFLLLVSVCTFLGITGIQKFIIDDVFVKSNFTLLTPYVAAFCIIAFTYLFSWVMKDILFERVNTRLKIILRQEYMQSMMKMPVKHYQNERLGSIFTHMQTLLDTPRILAYQIPMGIEHILNFLILAVVIGMATPLLLGGLFVFSISYIVVGKVFAPRIQQMAREVQEHRADLNVHIEEGISSTREVIAYHREAWEQKKIDTSYTSYYEKLMESAKLRNKQMRWTDPLQWGGSIVILSIGGYGVFTGHLTLGLFVVIYQFGNQFVQSVQGVYQFVIGIKESFVGVERARQLLQNEEISDKGQSLDGSIQSLRFAGVSFRYAQDRNWVLNELDLDVSMGKKTAFVGSSGGGKSTLAQLLVRFYEPDQGGIMINGYPIHQIVRKDWTSRVSIVFQEPYLFPETIENNITLGRTYTREQVAAACKIAEIHDFIMTMEDTYDTIIGERGITLSGGQRQRIAIARAVLGQPEILILDEATSALDQETERLVQANLDQARKDQTTIIIAHRLSTVENADMIHFMERGQVVESGTHAELVARRGYYHRLISKDQAV